MPTAVELRAERATVIAEARKKWNDAEKREGGPTEADKQEFDRALDAADNALEVITRKERIEAAEEGLEAPQPRAGVPIAGEVRGTDGAQAAASADLVRAAYRSWLRSGRVDRALYPDQERVARMAPEMRDTILSTDSKGGYLVAPVQVSADLVKAIDNMVWIRRLATVTRVTEAKKLGIRKMTARMADADWTTEVAAVIEDTGLAFDRRDLEPYLCSKLAKVSIRTLLLAEDAEQIVRDEMAYAFGVTEEKAYLTGNGVAKPLGVFVASAQGISTARDVVAGTATALTADGLIDAKYALKEGYLRDPSLRWIFHRDAIKGVRKLKDTTNQYLWSPGLAMGDPDRILDVPFHMSEFAPNTFTTGLYAGILGAFRWYRVAEVIDFVITRLNELYQATNEVGFIGRRWVDGAPLLEEAFVRLKLA
jgi:HK97 family phage major capsid protein